MSEIMFYGNEVTREKTADEEHTRSVLGNHTVNNSSLDVVDDVVACAGYKVAIAANFYIFLRDAFSISTRSAKHRQRESYPSSVFLPQALVCFLSIAGQDSGKGRQRLRSAQAVAYLSWCPVSWRS